MRRTFLGLTATALLAMAGSAHADCLGDLRAASAAQLKGLDEQDSVASRTTTTTTDLRTNKVVATVVTERAPPDRSRTIVRHGTAVEETVATGSRLWIGHGGPLQEVPDSTAKERIDDAHKRLLAFRAHVAATDWSSRARDLTCKPDTTLDGKPAELFTYTDTENKAVVHLYVTPDTHEAVRTELRGGGRDLVQTVERVPVTIDLPDSPAPAPAPSAAAPPANTPTAGAPPSHIPAPEILSPVRP